jgi:hypothetical protein
MTFLGRIQGRIRIGTTARALAAALAISGALVSLAPGEAHAAKKDDGIRCSMEIGDTIHFFMPGEVFYAAASGSRLLRCDRVGNWQQYRDDGPTPRGKGRR